MWESLPGTSGGLGALGQVRERSPSRPCCRGHQVGRALTLGSARPGVGRAAALFAAGRGGRCPGAQGFRGAGLRAGGSGASGALHAPCLGGDTPASPRNSSGVHRTTVSRCEATATLAASAATRRWKWQRREAAFRKGKIFKGLPQGSGSLARAPRPHHVTRLKLAPARGELAASWRPRRARVAAGRAPGPRAVRWGEEGSVPSARGTAWARAAARSRTPRLAPSGGHGSTPSLNRPRKRHAERHLPEVTPGGSDSLRVGPRPPAVWGHLGELRRVHDDGLALLGAVGDRWLL